MKYLNEVDIKGKRVLCRFDFNVPMDEHSTIADDRRIRAALPTINYVLDEDAKLIITAHLGRPAGKVVESLRLTPVARRLSRLLDREIVLERDCVGEDIKYLVNNMDSGSIVFLENLRFHKGETENDDKFAKILASYADVYVDDAFGNAHRSHASNVGITKYVKECCGGFLIKRELNYFKSSLKKPYRPLVAIVGGSKVSDKLAAIVNLVNVADKVIVGGGMAFTFLKSLGIEVGTSLVEEDLIGMAQKVIRKVSKSGVKFYLPVDCVIAQKKSKTAVTKIVPVQEIIPKWMGLDIGPASIRLCSEVIGNARTIVWNGPMGVFEIDAFSRGTYAMIHRIADSHALTIIGGGDTDVAVHRAGETDNISYISTGGGAFLDLVEGKKLPAIEALKKCNRR
ncbi:MAG: phosphoglycerate kinase [Thermodesulfobacteriota bacterium]|nr:phosphoglycerate kinase [Thermodesulfobacteriota bacterium]